MNENAALEARIGQLLDAYVDAAAIDVDPLAVTRLAAAAGHTRPAFRWAVAPARIGPRVVLLVIAALTVIGGTLLAGSAVRDPEPVVVPGVRVEPFLGLAPPGAALSGPGRADLELAFGGRILTRGFDRVWLYADGRFIWLWEKPSPNPVKERRLTPEGVELLRSELLGKATPVFDRDPGEPTTFDQHAGTLWGQVTVRVGDRVVPVTWSDAWLPMRLTNPASWLPAGAWVDPRAFGYVPARYAVCVFPDADADTLGRLPPTVLATLLDGAEPILPDPDSATPVPDCYQTTIETAREIEEALLEAGLRRRVSHGVTFVLRDGQGPEAELRILPMTPDGEIICECG